MQNNLKIVFFGTPDFVIPALKSIIDSGYTISAIFTGKGPIDQLARKHGIKIFQPSSLKKDEQVFEEFKNLKPDLCIVAAYGKILPQKFLDVPRHGFLNIHPSLLPKYRGPSPIQTAILNGDREAGISVMIVDTEIDHGPVLAEMKYQLDESKSLIETSQELFEIGASLLLKIIPEYISGKIKPKKQNHSQATFTKMFARNDGRLDWSRSSSTIHNQVRALNPEPGTWTTWKNKVINISNVTMFDIVSPQVVGLMPEVSGTVRRVGGDIVIGTGTGYLIIKSIQLEGGKEMDAKSFVNGHPDFLGSRLE